MENIELKRQAIEILNKAARKDSRLGTAWTGNAASIESVVAKSIRIMRMEVDYRKRKMRKERTPAGEPWVVKSEPASIDEWHNHPEWLPLDGWGDESEWKEICDYWEKCSDCNGAGGNECSSCRGTGRRTCPNCDGDGKISVNA